MRPALVELKYHDKPSDPPKPATMDYFARGEGGSGRQTDSEPQTRQRGEAGRQPRQRAAGQADSEPQTDQKVLYDKDRPRETDTQTDETGWGGGGGGAGSAK